MILASWRWRIKHVRMCQVLIFIHQILHDSMLQTVNALHYSSDSRFWHKSLTHFTVLMKCWHVCSLSTVSVNLIALLCNISALKSGACSSSPVSLAPDHRRHVSCHLIRNSRDPERVDLFHIMFSCAPSSSARLTARRTASKRRLINFSSKYLQVLDSYGWISEETLSHAYLYTGFLHPLLQIIQRLRQKRRIDWTQRVKRWRTLRSS